MGLERLHRVICDPYLAVGFDFVEKVSVRVTREDHAAGTVGDSVFRVSGDVFKYLVDGLHGAFGFGSLLGAKGTQGHEKLVVGSSYII